MSCSDLVGYDFYITIHFTVIVCDVETKYLTHPANATKYDCILLSTLK